MSLPSLIRIPLPISTTPHQQSPPEEEDPADIFTSALGSIFTDDAQNMHGNPGTAVIYRPTWRRPTPSPTPEPPSQQTQNHQSFYAKPNPSDILLHLADPELATERGLFAHYLWNSSLLVAELIGRWGEKDTIAPCPEGVGGEDLTRLPLGPRTLAHNWSVSGHSLLELGAGTGVAGITAAIAGQGAKRVCITDYPARDVLSAIRENVDENCSRENGRKGRVMVEGHEWGCFGDESSWERVGEGVGGEEGEEERDSWLRKGGFTRVVAADCLWLEAEHENLARSIAWFLAPESSTTEHSRESSRELNTRESSTEALAWVVAGFHTGRPKVAAFFSTVEQLGELEVVDRWEVDVEMRERDWDPGRDRVEGVGERKKWLLLAVLRRRR